MEVTVEDVLRLPTAHGCKLVAGKRGIRRTVRWFLGMLSPLIGPWVHGHEILFLYGVGMETNEASLLRLLEVCAAAEVSAMFFIIGPIFQVIPPAVQARADELCLPLVEMPNEIPVVDITKDIADLLNSGHRVALEKGNLLKNILMGHGSSDEQERIRALSRIVHVGQFHNIVCIRLQVDSLAVDSILLHQIDQALTAAFGEALYYLDADHTVVLLCSSPQRDLAGVIRRCELFLQEFSSCASAAVLSVGVGSTVDTLECIADSYATACKALGVGPETPDTRVVSYEQLSAVSKLLYEVRDPAILRECFEPVLGPLLAYDAAHGADLLHTLSVFLEEDGSLTRAAQRLYIHKNTMSYRMGRIGALLDLHLDQIRVRCELLTALRCYRQYQALSR